MTLWLRTENGIVPVGGAYQTVTPWTPITLNSPWGAFSSRTPQVRRVGDRIEFSGMAYTTDNSTPMSYSVVGTVPAGFEPPIAYFDLFTVPANNSNNSVMFDVNANGDIRISGANVTWGSTNKFVSFAPISYSLTATGQAPDYTQAPNGLWTDYTPNVYQSVGVTVSPSHARYVKIGQTVIVHVYLTLTSTGTAGQAIRFSVPYPMLPNTSIVGEGRLVDASGPYTIYPATLERFDANTVVLSSSTTSAVNSWFLGTAGTPFTDAVTNGDAIQGMFVYEADT